MESTGTSLLPADVITTITGFASSIVPTVLALLAILIPIGLSCWAIGFGIKKGLGYLKKQASKSV